GLKGERDEALDQQTTTSDILRVISTSPTDVQSVFTAIVKSAVKLCGTLTSCVWRFDGELIHLVAHHKLPPEVLKVYQGTYPLPLSKDKLLGQALLQRKPVNIADVLASYRSSVGQRMSAFGVKRTWRLHCEMSANDPKRTWQLVQVWGQMVLAFAPSNRSLE